MRDLSFTLFNSVYLKKGILKIKSWDEWILNFKIHDFRGDPTDSDDIDLLEKFKLGPCLMLGSLKANSIRAKKNVLKADAIAIDIDKLNDHDLQEAISKLNSFEWIAYTTHKNRARVEEVGGKARLRIILPLSSSVSPEEYPKAWKALDKLVGGVNDPQTKDISRLHFFPSTFDESLCEFHHNKGEWLDPTKLVDTDTDEKQNVVQITQRLDSLREKLKRILKTDDLKASAKALLKGEPLAEPTKRHETILKLTMWIAQRERELRESELLELFQPSLDRIGHEFSEVLAAYRGAVDKVEAYEREQQHKGSSEYTRNELEEIAKKQNCSVEELRERWIIQTNGGGWILDRSGDYRGLFSYRDLPLAISKHLKQCPQVNLLRLTPSGYKHKTVVEIIRESGSLAEQIFSDMTRQTTVFDAKRGIMREAICPIRTDLEPRYDPQINEWLEKFAGSLYMKLIDWLSAAPDLDKLLCALYFDGVKGAGKGLFAEGVAHIWTEGASTKLELVLSDFNEALTKCPIVFADEELPKKFQWQTITPKLRAMLATTSRELTRKHLSASSLKGAIRLILAANNEFLLDSREVATRQDLEAIAQRFLYVPVSKDAVALLEETPKPIKREWLERGIAEHVLYLAEHHTIQKPGSRFEVEGDVSQMHRLLMTGSHWNSLTCEWLVRYLSSPEPFNELNNGLIQIREGDFLVNEQALIDGWDLYLKTKEPPSTSKIGAALRAISSTSKRKQLRWNGRKIRYRYIDVDHLVSWSDRFNIGDTEQLRARVAGRELEDRADVIKLKDEQEGVDVVDSEEEKKDGY